MLGLLQLPELEAGSFVLRPFMESDVELIFEAAQDPLIPLITTVPSLCDTASAQAFIERQHERLRTGQGYSFAIASSTGQAIGQIGLWPQQQERASLGYWIVASQRGRGAAQQALTAMSRFGLDCLDLERLELYVEPWNEASWRTAERAGYRREGVLRKYQRINQQRKDMYMYSLLKDDIDLTTNS